MGNTGSKDPSDDTQLSEKELKILRAEFRTFLDKQNAISVQKLEAHFEKRTSRFFCQRLCHVLGDFSKPNNNHRGHRSNQSITFTGLATLISGVLKGDQSAQCSTFMKLSRCDGLPAATDVFKILFEMLTSYLTVIKTSQPYISWEKGVSELDSTRLTHCLLHDLFYGEKVLADAMHPNLPDRTFSEEEIEKWYTSTPVVANVMFHLFSLLFKLGNGNNSNFDQNHRHLVPMCEGVNWDLTNSLLSMLDILLLNQHLPAHLRNSWRYLYSSRQFGESFSSILRKIVNEGPNIIIIKDQHGDVFGGFASESWKVQPQFHGSSECFLFTLRPHSGIYEATGYNDHYMYLNLKQQTMPNGLGMGGQLEYFALWLDSDYGKGTCAKTCSTFHSPPLCPTELFQIEVIEVWGVGPKKKVSETEGTRSILDNVDPELQAILEMTNRAPISGPIREADARAAHQPTEEYLGC